MGRAESNLFKCQWKAITWGFEELEKNKSACVVWVPLSGGRRWMEEKEPVVGGIRAGILSL